MFACRFQVEVGKKKVKNDLCGCEFSLDFVRLKYVPHVRLSASSLKKKVPKSTVHVLIQLAKLGNVDREALIAQHAVFCLFPLDLGLHFLSLDLEHILDWHLAQR